MNALLRIVILATIAVSDGFRILGVFPFPGKSHWAMYSTVMKELARKGHQVDVISPFPLQEPIKNYKDITVNITLEIDPHKDVTFEMVNDMGVMIGVFMIAQAVGNDLCHGLKEQKLQDFIHNASRDAYDIVIVEIFGANCFLAFGHHFDVPIVGLTSSVVLPWANDPMGNVDNPSYIPNFMLPYTENMTFWQRLYNTLINHFIKISFNLVTRYHDKIIEESFGPGAPGVRELERRIDLLLVNSHFSLNSVRPFTPGVIEVGGLHLQDDKGVLTPELSKWLDDSSSGVVYFSMGSMLKSESFPPDITASLYASFAKLAPVRVLWKADKSKLPKGLPDNVLTMTWIPQSLVIKHKNMKVFITHGGLMGTQEAIYAGVPLIGIPFFGDQALNIHNYVSKKLAVSIDSCRITEESLDKALKAVLEDPAYRENARRISNKFRDRPQSPLDTAVWWIEYIGRHGKGALRSPSLDLTWWQVALLDVYGFLILSTILTFYLLKYSVKKMFSKTTNFSQDKSKKSQ